MTASLHLVFTAGALLAWRVGALLVWAALVVVAAEVVSHILRPPHRARHGHRHAH